MSYQLPPLVWLRAFEAAARLSSFTAAAADLGLTQAAVSHQVRSLERHLGFPLFERLPRSLRLTDMGHAYLPPVRKAFDELSASTVGLFGRMGERPVSVRAPISFAVLWLAPRLRSFVAAYPDIDIRLCTSVWADAMAQDDADVELRFGDGRWPGCDVGLIDDQGSVPVCAEVLCAEIGFSGAMTEFAPNHLLHVVGCEDLWSRLFRQIGAAGVASDKGVKSDTSLAALELAVAGVGCALVLRSFAAPYIARGQLRLAADIELPLDQAHYLVLRQGERRLRPEVALFRDWLLDEARRTPLSVAS